MKTLTIACLFAAAIAPAQPNTAPSPAAISVPRVAVGRLHLGAQTRVQTTASTSGPIIGTLQAVDDARLTIEMPGGALIQTPLHEIRSLETWRPRHRKTAKWALLGAVAGGAGLALVGAAASDTIDERAHGVAYGLVFGALGGASVGAIGGTFAGAGGWTEVALVPTTAGDLDAQGPPAPRMTAPVGPNESRQQRSRADTEWRLRPTFHRGAGLALNVAW